VRVTAAGLPSAGRVRTVESSTATIEYADGSVATVVYSAVGAPSLPKERIEVLRAGRAWVLDDFTSLSSYAAGEHQVRRARRPDKGHAALLANVLAAARGDQPFAPGLGAAYGRKRYNAAFLHDAAGRGTKR